jgi:hypothetical protein
MFRLVRVSTRTRRSTDRCQWDVDIALDYPCVDPHPTWAPIWARLLLHDRRPVSIAAHGFPRSRGRVTVRVKL